MGRKELKTERATTKHIKSIFITRGMNDLPYSKESYALMLRAQWVRQVIDREEKERAKWKKTGSREGLAQFRARLIARQAVLTTFINSLLIVILSS